jgi:hypothetical protein
VKHTSWKTIIILCAASIAIASTRSEVFGEEPRPKVPLLTVILAAEQPHIFTPIVTTQGQRQQLLEHDKDSNRWEMPLEPNPEKLITPYVVAINPADAHIVAIRIDFPSTLEGLNQTVVLQLPQVKDASDSSVGLYWGGDYGKVIKNPGAVETRLRALQDLHFFVAKHQAESSTSPPSARRVRAAFMLLTVVQDLGQQTWYVVADEYQNTVKYAASVLARVKHEDACKWLGPSSCRTIDELLERHKNLEGSRLGRIYSLIIPEGSTFSPSFCDDERIRNLDNYYTYFTSMADSITAHNLRTGSGVSEIRVASAFASCVVLRTTCDQSYGNKAKKMLEEASDKLKRAKMMYRERSAVEDADNRIAEVSEILRAIKEERPMKCSYRETRR